MTGKDMKNSIELLKIYRESLIEEASNLTAINFIRLAKVKNMIAKVDREIANLEDIMNAWYRA